MGQANGHGPLVPLIIAQHHFLDGFDRLKRKASQQFPAIGINGAVIHHHRAGPYPQGDQMFVNEGK